MTNSTDDPGHQERERGVLDLWGEIVRTATLVRAQARDNSGQILKKAGLRQPLAPEELSVLLHEADDARMLARLVDELDQRIVSLGGAQAERREALSHAMGADLIR